MYFHRASWSCPKRFTQNASKLVRATIVPSTLATPALAGPRIPFDCMSRPGEGEDTICPKFEGQVDSAQARQQEPRPARTKCSTATISLVSAESMRLELYWSCGWSFTGAFPRRCKPPAGSSLNQLESAIVTLKLEAGPQSWKRDLKARSKHNEGESSEPSRQRHKVNHVELCQRSDSGTIALREPRKQRHAGSVQSSQGESSAWIRRYEIMKDSETQSPGSDDLGVNSAGKEPIPPESVCSEVASEPSPKRAARCARCAHLVLIAAATRFDSSSHQ